MCSCQTLSMRKEGERCFPLLLCIKHRNFLYSRIPFPAISKSLNRDGWAASNFGANRWRSSSSGLVHEKRENMRINIRCDWWRIWLQGKRTAGDFWRFGLLCGNWLEVRKLPICCGWRKLIAGDFFGDFFGDFLAIFLAIILSLSR